MAVLVRPVHARAWQPQQAAAQLPPGPTMAFQVPTTLGGHNLNEPRAEHAHWQAGNEALLRALSPLRFEGKVSLREGHSAIKLALPVA